MSGQSSLTPDSHSREILIDKLQAAEEELARVKEELQRRTEVLDKSVDAINGQSVQITALTTERDTYKIQVDLLEKILGELHDKLILQAY